MRRILTVTLTLVVLALAASTALAGPLEGRWHLVAESYGGGRGNLAGDHRPVDLDFKRVGGELAGTMRWKKDGAFVAWPVAPDSERSGDVRVVERSIAAGEDRVRIRYTVAARPGDDLELDIVEDYRVVEDGRALVGTVDVNFVRAGKPGGSYRLHRRFEKRP